MEKNISSVYLVNKVCTYFRRTDEEKSTYKCEIENCNKSLSGKNRSNLVMHVRRRHKTFFDKNFGQIRNEDSDGVSLRIKRLNYIQTCVELVAVNGLPFTILNESGVKKMLQADYELLKHGKFGAGLGPPHYRAIKSHIKKLSCAVANKIKAETCNVSVSIMADSATRHHRSILGVSIQYMYCGQLKIRTIGMMNMTVAQTAENLMKAIIDRLEFYGIQTNQILSITTDNASNMSAMVNRINDYCANGDEFENRIEASGSNDESDSDSDKDGDCDDHEDEVESENRRETSNYFFDSSAFDFGVNTSDDDDHISLAESFESDRFEEVNDILNEANEFESLLKDLERRFSIHTLNIHGIRCAVHTLQLAIKDALEETSLTKLIQNCRNICKLLKKGKTRTILKQNQITSPIPKLDCKTRWNSTYRMVRISLRFRSFYVNRKNVYHVHCKCLLLSAKRPVTLL